MDLKVCSITFLTMIILILPVGGTLISIVPSGIRVDGTQDFGLPSEVLKLNDHTSARPIKFIVNQGQWDRDVRYLAETPFGYSMVMENGFLLGFRYGENDLAVVKYEFLDSLEPKISGLSQLPTKYNYFIGSDPTRWSAGVSAFEEVCLEDLWEGIDLRLYSENSRLKYDFILHPGSDLQDIDIKIRGAEILEFEEGYLDLNMPGQIMISDGPLISYQEEKSNTLHSSIVLRDENEFGFEVGDYDRSRELVIDPVIAGNFIGGWGGEYLHDMVLDGKGHQFMTGHTTSTDFPVTPGAYQNYSKGRKEIFVCKADMNGTSLHYATYIGGYSDDEGGSIAVDDHGNAFVTGTTTSGTFPITTGALDRYYNGTEEEGFLFKLDQNGENLSFSTYLGGSHQDVPTSVIIANDGDVVVAGHTRSEDFNQTDGAYEPPLSGTKDGFITRITNDGSEYVYSFLFGGPSAEECYDLSELPDGSLVVCGNTTSPEFPMTSNSYDPNYHGFDDVYLVRFSEDGTGILSSTFLGGDNQEFALSLDTDDEGSVYVTGHSFSLDFPTTEGCYQKNWSTAWDVYVAKFDNNLSSLIYSTFLGSGENEFASGVAVDRYGRAHVIGRTHSKYYPTTWGAFQEDVKGEGDIFMTILNKDASDLEYSTFVGGSGYDYATSVKMDDHRNVYLAGWTSSGNFPHKSSGYGPNILGFSDGFALCLDLSLPPSEPYDLQGEKGEGHLNLTWNPPAMDYGLDILNYRVHKSIGDPTGEARTYWLSGTETFFNDTYVFIGQKYYYRVSAKTIAGFSNLSDTYAFYYFIEPSVPLNLELEYDGISIIAEWDPPSNNGGSKLMNYSIVKKWEGGQSSFLPEANETINLFVDDNITKGVTYTYSVSAWNGYHWSESVEANITPLTTPTPPMDLNVLEGSGFAFLEWGPPSDLGGSEILGYHIYRGVTEGNETLFTTREGKDTYYNDSTVVNGLSYVYFIRAINEIGISAPSNRDRAEPTGVPYPPWKLTAREKENSVMLQWDPPITDGGYPIHTYQIFRSEPGLEPYLYYEANGSTYTFMDISVEPNSIYFYYVIAVSDLGASDPSDVAQVTLEGYPTPPRDMSLTRGDGFVMIEWLPPTDNGFSLIRNYRVYRKTEDEKYSFLAEVLSQFQSHNDTSVENGELYFYRLTAVNDKGESRPCHEDSAMPVGVPYHPMNLQAESEESYIQLSWSAPIDDGGVRIVKYVVYRGSAPDMMSSYAEVYSSELRFKDVDVRIGLDHYYYVVAYNGKYYSPKSQMVKGIPKGLPGTAENLTITSTEEGIRLTWEPPANTGGTEIRYFHIYRKIDDGNFTLIRKLDGFVFIFDDRNVEDPGQYSYYIAVENEMGTSQRTDYISWNIEENNEQDDGPWGLFRSSAMILLGLSFLILIIAGLISLRRRSKREYDQLHSDEQVGSEFAMEDEPYGYPAEPFEDDLLPPMIDGQDADQTDAAAIPPDIDEEM